MILHKRQTTSQCNNEMHLIHSGTPNMSSQYYHETRDQQSANYYYNVRSPQSVVVSPTQHLENEIISQEIFELVNILSSGSQTPEVYLIQACERLFVLYQQDESHEDIIFSTGAIPEIIRMMSWHYDSATIQHTGCVFLRHLFVGTKSNSPWRHQIYSMMKKGGIHAVIDAMQRHPTNASVQEHGCAILNFLASSCCSSNNTTFQNEIVLAGGVPLLINALDGHTWIREIQKQACMALSQLTKHTVALEFMRSDGGARLISLLSAAVRHFPDDCQCSAGKIIYSL